MLRLYVVLVRAVLTHAVVLAVPQELQWVDLRDLSFPALDLRTCWGLVVNVKVGAAAVGLALGSCGLGSCRLLFLRLALISRAYMQGRGALARIFGGRHWFAVRRFGGRWFVLDSLLDGPQGVASLVEAAIPGVLPPATAAGAVNPQLLSWPRGGPAACDEGAVKTQSSDNSAAMEELALKRFLAQSVQLQDGKIFVVVESKLASHPLPDAPLDTAAPL